MGPAPDPRGVSGGETEPPEAESRAPETEPPEARPHASGVGPPEAESATPGYRLDPDLAAREGGDGTTAPPDERGPTAAERARSVEPAINTRPYRWMIGIFGLLLAAAASTYQLAKHGVGTAGVPAGKPLHFFAAPLAASTLNGDANVKPPCAPGRHDPRALNVCLLVSRTPLVLAFFVTGSEGCKRQVDALQALSGRFPAREVRFAAVAVRSSHTSAANAVRAHGWTIPVAYDRDGAVGALYGVDICPLLELARRGGIVSERLIGNHWSSPAVLAPRVASLVGK